MSHISYLLCSKYRHYKYTTFYYRRPDDSTDKVAGYRAPGFAKLLPNLSIPIPTHYAGLNVQKKPNMVDSL